MMILLYVSLSLNWIELIIILQLHNQEIEYNMITPSMPQIPKRGNTAFIHSKNQMAL